MIADASNDHHRARDEHPERSPQNRTIAFRGLFWACRRRLSSPRAACAPERPNWWISADDPHPASKESRYAPKQDAGFSGARLPGPERETLHVEKIWIETPAIPRRSPMGSAARSRILSSRGLTLGLRNFRGHSNSRRLGAFHVLLLTRLATVRPRNILVTSPTRDGDLCFSEALGGPDERGTFPDS
jgi:hypothetical protein